MNYILFSRGSFQISIDDQTTVSDSKMINHYKNITEQLRQSHDWKSGTEHIFGDSFMLSKGNSYFEPIVNGISSVNGDHFYYGLELEKGGGIYKKSKVDADDEGFLFTSNDIVPQHISACGNRIACSMKYADGTSHIAMFVSERPDYYEFTAGDSVDEHPFIHNGTVLFTSAGVRRDINGNVSLGNRGISKYDIEKRSVQQLLYSEDHEYLLPKVDTNGDLYCIRRPVEKRASVGSALIGVLTAPFWIFAAIVGFLSAFVRIFSGKQLMGKSNRDSAKETAKEIVDGCDIDIEREEKRNRKAGDKYPGYAPRSWELIRIPNGANMTDAQLSEAGLKPERVCRGVIGYELLGDGSFVISNGSCIVHHYDGGVKLISKAGAVNRNFTVLNV